MGNYGIKITRPGYGMSETDERNYAFWSKLATVKIFKQGSGTAVIPQFSSSVTVQIAHGLSFIPMYMLFSQLKDGSGKWFINRTNMSSGDADAGDQYLEGGFMFPPYQELGLFIDSTNLNIEYATHDNSVAHDIDYYYFIFGDKGGT